MIPVTAPVEPVRFDSECRQKGHQWLHNHPNSDRFPNYWSGFRVDLAAATEGRCYWLAIRIVPPGQVDHFRPVSEIKQSSDRRDIYEWSNLRYIAAVLNTRKRTRRVLDPFEIQPGWFEVTLPDLRLRRTEKVPQHLVDLAESTICDLALNNEDVRGYREEFFLMYRRRDITLTGLRTVDPLLADAIQRDLDRGVDHRHPEGTT